MFKSTNIIAVIIGVSSLYASFSQAETFAVTISNATAAQVITPPVVITHNANVSLFKLGQAAPDYLVPLAEGGDSSALAGAESSTNVQAVVMAEGAVLPGHSLTINIEASTEFPLITIAGMLATSNDAFMSVHDQPLDFNFVSNNYNANVYDAGSEFNSEDCQFIPGPPCGNGGVRDTDNAEGFVHVHRGIYGISSLAAKTYNWQNPGAVVTIKRIQ